MAAHRYDQDGNGTISKEEFGMAMQSLGMDQSEQDLAEMMALADGDQVRLPALAVHVGTLRPFSLCADCARADCRMARSTLWSLSRC